MMWVEITLTKMHKIIVAAIRVSGYIKLVSEY
jgi:hypothetical protein